MNRTIAFLMFAGAAIGMSAQEGTAPDRHNLIKIGLSSGVFNIVSLNYERVLHPDWSVGLTASYMVPRAPSSLFSLNTEEITIDASHQLSGYYLTPEVKWFFESSDTRSAPRGLYADGYLRWSDTRYTGLFEAEGSGIDAEGQVSGELELSFQEFGIGIGLGYQLLALRDRLVFDFIFLAPRYALYRIKVDAALNGDGQLAEDLGEAIEDVLGRDIVPVDLEIDSQGTTVVDRNSLGYRFGIKVGYAF